MIKDILQETRSKMEKAVWVVGEDLATIKTGRARPALVDKIKVEAYEGTSLELRELANITIAESQQIVINPWDKSVIGKICQAISQSGLNLNPIAEKGAVRIKIPVLTGERRKEMARLIDIKIEAGRKMIRNLRNEFKAEIEGLKGESGVSKDDIFRGLEDLQKLHNEFIDEVEKLGQEKKKEIGL